MAISSMAQSLDEGSDAKALELLQSLQQDYESYEAHLFDFTIKMELPEQSDEIINGTLLQKGEMFNLDVSDRLIINDTETVWVYLKDRNELQINDADFEDEENVMSPSYLFDLYQSDDYLFAISAHTYEEGQAVTQIECKPLDPESEYSKLRLTIEDKTKRVKRVKLFNKDGSRMTMTVDKHDKGVKIDGGTFGFDQADYEGLTVEDLRF